MMAAPPHEMTLQSSSLAAVATVKSCVLLLSTDPIVDRAEKHARSLFAMRSVLRHTRSERRLARPLPPADLLLNFLSAPYVPPTELAKFGTAVNFHPAPPEYPGVGSASLALYDGRKYHGVTAHIMTERYDAGPIIRVQRFLIPQPCTYARLFELSLAESLLLFFDVTAGLARGAAFQCDEQWARRAYTRSEFEAHPAFHEVR